MVETVVILGVIAWFTIGCLTAWCTEAVVDFPLNAAEKGAIILFWPVVWVSGVFVAFCGLVGRLMMLLGG